MTRRHGLLLLTSILLGPLIGVLTFSGVGGAMDAVSGQGASSFGFLFENWPIVLMAGYIFGVVPGLAFAIGMAIIGPRLRTRRVRLIVAPILGAVLSVVLLSTALFGLALSSADWSAMLMLALPGAAAALVCMLLVEWLEPLPPEPVS
jgi:hypothetical protein